MLHPTGNTPSNGVVEYRYNGPTIGSWEEYMSFSRFRPMIALFAIAAVLAFAVTDADARAGRGGSFGSRGSQTFSAPPSTATSPTTRPIERSMTQ